MENNENRTIPFYKISISVIFGILGFAINFHTIKFPFPPYIAVVLIGLLFPMLITLSWGWRYGLLSALTGGCQTMWWLWGPSNGYAIFFVVPPFTLWIMWHGFFAQLRKRQKEPVWWLNEYIIEIPFRLLSTINLLTLSRWAITLNPPSWKWALDAPNTIPMHFSNFIVIKQATVGYIILLLSDVLLNFGFARRFFRLKKIDNQTNTGYIISASLLIGALFWLIDSIFGSLVFHTEKTFLELFALNVPSYNIFIRTAFILSCLVGGLLAAKLLRKQRESDIALRESEERYRTIFEDSRDAIYINTQEGEFIDVNQSMLKLFGYTKEEMVGMNAINLYANSLDRLESFREIEQKGSHKDYEIKLKKKDGEEMDCLLTSTIKMADDGSIVGYQGIFRDITEQKRLDEERKKLQAQLQRAQKMEAIGTLAGGVAHDLNNVLSGIVSYPDLLLMDIPEDSPLRKPILTIQESGQKAAAIVQDLLTLARRGVVATDVTNINQVIDSYLISPEHEKLKEFYPDAKIESDLEINLLNIMGSYMHLSKTVMNLVTNAAEAMSGGGNIFISTQSKYIDKPIRGYDDVKEGDYVTLTVSDTGTGISSGDLERIFEPFYTKKVMGRSGTGLGMAVVWGTIKDHKGYIDVQSTEGKGTTFTLYFPVIRKEMPGKEKALSMEEYMGKGESILVVDDVKEQREIASRILIKLGYSATCVSSGEEAIDYMKDNSADLLVLDMIMNPGIDGLETYKRILKLHPGQKAIIASGFSETERVKETQRLGAGKYVKKPYTMEIIGIAVKEELERLRK